MSSHRVGGWEGLTAEIVVMNRAQRCEMHNRVVFRWVGGSACRVLLLPFWSRATLRATLKDLPPTQRCVAACIVKRVQVEALQFSSFKQMSSHRVGGWEGLTAEIV